jgi:hypothetical protein
MGVEAGAPPPSPADDPFSKLNTDQLDYARILSSKGLDPRDQKNWGGYESYLAKQTKARAPSTTNIVGGAVAPTTAGQTTQQGAVLQAQMRLELLGNMKKAIAEAGGYDAVTSFVPEGGAVPKMMSRAGMGSEYSAAAIKLRSRAVAAIGGFTNPIISELAGANVPDGEMRRMVQSLPTVDDAGPELEAKIEMWGENLKIMERFGIDYLVNGIRTGAIPLPGETALPVPVTRGGVTKMWDPVKNAWVK